MSDVFVSYKREDEARVLPLVRALEASGLDVWWDRGLPGGESWRANIEAALEGARCVVVVWSKNSVAPEGHFVRDEAGHAMAKGRLVPVLIDRVAPPLGFREMQAVDLSHWRGNARDPFFQDVVAAIGAKLSGGAPPEARGPMARLRWRLTLGSASTAAVAILASLAFNTFGVASQVCTAASMQPLLSDGCGAIGIGGRPTREERLFWAARRPGSCADLRNYIDRHHARGAYLIEANALLAARRVTMVETFTPGTRQLPIYVARGAAPFASDAAARAEALARGLRDAERLCRGFAATTTFKFVSAKAEPQAWDCASGVCSFEGQAVCALQERHMSERETCGR